MLGVPVSKIVTNARLKLFNFGKVNTAGNLQAVHQTLRSTLGLTPEVNTPTAAGTNKGTLSLLRGGLFASLNPARCDGVRSSLHHRS
ncbi:MAG: hypothetical protein QM770_18735 [Tepidisphaeraceae bacterium]